MDVLVRRAVSEFAMAYADAMRSLADFELEDQTPVAARVARQLDMVSIRAGDVKAAMREQLRRAIFEGGEA